MMRSSWSMIGALLLTTVVGCNAQQGASVTAPEGGSTTTAGDQTSYSGGDPATLMSNPGMSLALATALRNCTYTIGYWKNHPAAWPVGSVTLGTVTYTEQQALAILGQPVQGNGLVSLAHQLIGAKLNVAQGADSSALGTAIADADALIGGLTVPPVGAGYLDPSTTSALNDALDNFNSGITGPGHCGDTPPPPVCGNGKLEAGEACDDGNNMDGDGCSANCTKEPPPPVCGDGNIDAGEECDDGNGVNGDCCSSNCQFDAAGSSCADATVCNGDETCDGAGNCVGGMPLDCDDGNLCTPDSCEPVGGCVHGTSPFAGCRTALRSTLHLKSDADDANDTLVWKWAKGQTTAQADFGVPSATTKSALCIYTIYIGSTPTLVAEYDVPADAVKWSAISTKGYKYTDPAGGTDGIRKIVLKGGTQNKSKCVVKGKGSGLNDLDLLTLFDPLIVQLVNSSTPACFESTFTQADFVIFNDSAEFKAKAH